MKLHTVRNSNVVWSVRTQTREIAILHMDYAAQLDQVVLSPGISSEQELAVLRLAASHVARYVVRRYHSNGILEVTYHGKADRYLSDQFLQDGLVSDVIKAMDLEQLSEALRQTGIPVIDAAVSTLHDALSLALGDLQRTIPISYQLIGDAHTIILGQRVTFSVKSPHQFRAWHSVGEPGSGFDLYIVPAYHPDNMASKSSVGLINGATDAFIGRKSVMFVQAPAESRNSAQESFYGSWSRMTHPFYATGSEITLTISPTKSLSTEGIGEIASVLTALLELEDTYVSVSGGFNPPLTHPQNVARRFGIRTSSWEGDPRGSEGFCVWAHRVLEAEGELAKAYVPAWFKSEPWLRAYEQYG